MKVIEEKTDVELGKMLMEARNRLRELRFKIAAHQLTDVREIRAVRNDVARILTIMSRHGRQAGKTQ